MKKSTILSVMCAVMLVNLGNAQDIQLGVKGSFLTSTIATPDDGWGKLRPSYDVGIFAQYNLSDQLGVSLEPAFAKKGTDEFDPLLIYSQTSPLLTNNGESIEYKSHSIQMSVIQIPVLAQLKMDMGGMQMRLFGGPSFDFITSANHLMVREFPGATDDFTYEINDNAEVTERFVYTDYTAVVGIGFDIAVDPIDLRIDIKYQHGFTDINNVEGKPAIYTRTFGVSLGIGLDKLIF